MKFGVLKYKPYFEYLRTHKFNIGDNIQSHAIRNIYKYMGIDDKEIIEVNKYDLINYDGEYIILPMANFCSLDTLGTFPLSSKIIPVYIGFHLSQDIIPQHYVEHFRNFQPIGCRDEYTLKNMRKHNIVAYLSGCVTATLPKRIEEPKKPKAFFVDVPEGVTRFIPDDIKRYSEFTTHVHHYSKVPLEDSEIQKVDEMAIEQYRRYKDEATLVVTSRLHCASPCIAMGIPIILVRELYAYTLLAVDKYVHVYMPDEFDRIDWSIQKIDYEEQKRRLLEIFSQQIQDTYNKYSKISDISFFYENRESYDYERGYKDKLVELKKSLGSKIKCAIWGANIHARSVLKALPVVFEDYEVVDIIDEYKKGDFYEYTLKTSNCIDNHDEDVVYIITADAAVKQASEVLGNLNRKYISIH